MYVSPIRGPGKEGSIAAYLVAAEDVVGLAIGITQDGYLDNEIDPSCAARNFGS